MPIAGKITEFIERSSWIRAMFEAGAKLKAEVGPENVYDFSLGNPYPEPPEAFFQTLNKLLAEKSPGVHGYPPNAGYPAVRAKVAQHLTDLHGCRFGEGDIIMTVGAGGGLNIILKAIVDPGADVVVPTPYFVEYDFYLDNFGGSVTRVPTREDFSLNVGAIAEAISDKTAAVLINSPNNPTGAVYGREELAELGRALREAGEKRGRPIYLICDEPYRDIIYDGLEAPSLFELFEHTILATSFSKNLSLAGERIGYVAVHPDIADKAQLTAGMTLANRILGFVNAPALMQRVVAELLDVSVDVSVYARKRELICKVLDQAGFDYIKPQGTFYVFPRSPDPDDVAFVRAGQEENLLLVPGSGFMGPGHFRIAFCCADDVITRSADAFKRLRARY